MNVARLGSHASLNVSGTDSSLIQSGVGSSVTGNGGIGAGGIVGREAGSIGAINVTNGGTILVRTVVTLPYRALASNWTTRARPDR
jgi:hypothetical protein